MVNLFGKVTAPMAVAIRLKRLGRTHRPFYRIDAIEKRNARNGRSLENLGHYDPFAKEAEKQVVLKTERVQFWIDQGARPSATVTSFLRKADIRWGNPKKKSRKSMQRKRQAEAKKKG